MIIAERYEILGKIGTGGMADVYKATDHKLNRFVAVKVLKAEFREDATFIRKFRSEAQAAAGLTHPNIVNVYDVGDDEGINYIVMELIEGITLKEYIGKKTKLSVKEATSIAIQVSMGLEAAHSHGIVHRDIKPQNIIISTDGKVKVMDFGIARAASSNTISSNVMGSVHYSSPEQVRGGYSDEKSDIYSLGITLYEMVTGKVPFDGDTTVAIAIKHLQEEMVAPSVYTEDLPNSLEQIIFKCTQKSVSRRYEKMEDVIADLKHSLIDPQGDFVKIAPANAEGKTVVISDEELGKIKNSPKNAQRSGGRGQADVQPLEPEVYESEFDEEDEEDTERENELRKRREKRRSKQRVRRVLRALMIVALLIGAAALVWAIMFIGNKSGLIEKLRGNQEPVIEQQTEEKKEEDNLVVVPDLVGKTEAEASKYLKDQGLKIGIQLIGEEASNQEKGRISSQTTPEGTRVAVNTTIQYYVSRGAETFQMPGFDGMNAIEAEKMLKERGLEVNVQKQYSEFDYDGYPYVEPGYVLSVYPESGSTMRSGDIVTLTVSRGGDYGNQVYVPSVVGMSRDNAITTLGKWLNINVTYQQSFDVPEGEVISQNPAGDEVADPDGDVSIVVSSGANDPTVMEQQETSTPEEILAIANGETWKCTQSLNTPEGYTGGAVRLELIQQISGQQTSSIILEGQSLNFPYDLGLTGAPGVASGELHLAENIEGHYIELGKYTLTFEKVE